MQSRNITCLLATLCLTLAASATLAADSAEARMTLVPSGATAKIGGYAPQRLELAAARPVELKKSPPLAAPLFGKLNFGGTAYLVALDEPDGRDAALYVDANANGDLTDDPPTTWKKQMVTGAAAGQQLTQYTGGFKLPLTTGAQPTLVSLSAYRFDKADPQRAALKNTLLYYRDYAYEGDLILAGQKYHALLADESASGDFRKAGARLLIDVNNDGKFAARGQTFDAGKPFNIKGTTWALANLTAAGVFTIGKSAVAVAEILPPPDHSVGKTITAFAATRMDGTAVQFPGDYKGKIVMLDFWATWCGPCMAEVPNLVKTYNEYHAQGIEILGISLDQANAAAKIKSTTADNGMTWPQVYDGKYWDAEIAVKYGIDSIPAAFLVDGDTGEILAAGDTLRGTGLAKSFEAAVLKKAAKGRP